MFTSQTKRSAVNKQVTEILEENGYDLTPHNRWLALKALKNAWLRAGPDSFENSGEFDEWILVVTLEINWIAGVFSRE